MIISKNRSVRPFFIAQIFESGYVSGLVAFGVVANKFYINRSHKSYF